MKYLKDRIPERIAHLGSGLFGEPLSADGSINRIEAFFHSIGCPTRLSDMNIQGDLKKSIYETMVINKVNGANLKLKKPDYFPLIDLFL